MNQQVKYTMGIQIQSLYRCVGISIDGNYKIEVEFCPSVILNTNPSIKICTVPFKTTGLDVSAEKLQSIALPLNEFDSNMIMHMILKNLKMTVLSISNFDLQVAIYTVPGSFDEIQKESVRVAGCQVNLDMKNIDEHYAFALALRGKIFLQPTETILVFDLSNGKIIVTLIITGLDYFYLEITLKREISFEKVALFDKQIHDHIPSKTELDKSWENHGKSFLNSVIDSQDQIDNVILVGTFNKLRMNHLIQLFTKFFEEKDKKIKISNALEWDIVHVAAIIAQKLDMILNLQVDEITIIVKSFGQQDQISIINKLKIHSKPLFQELCLMTDHFKDDEYRTQFRMLKELAEHGELKKCNKQLLSQYGQNENRGYSLYLNLQKRFINLRDPELTLILLTKLKQIQPNSNCEDFFKDLLNFLNQEDEEEVAEYLIKIKVQDESFFQTLIQDIYKILPDVEQEILIKNAPVKHRKVSFLFKKQGHSYTQIEIEAAEKFLKEIQISNESYLSPLQNYLKKNNYPMKYQQSYQETCKFSQSKLSQLFIDQKLEESQFQIEDFMNIDPKFDTKTAEINIVSYYQKENKLCVDDVCLLLFDYIKKRCNFSNLIDQLSRAKNDRQEQIECHLTVSALFNLLMKHSDTHLKTLLFMACSRFMPVPFISYDWDNYKLLLREELFFSYEKRKAIFNFKLSSNKMLGPRGCSSLANSLLNKNFQLYSSMLTNQGSIDIQFDYNFASPLYVPVADAHGYLNRDTLRKVYFLFDIFIIHIVNRQEDKILLDEEIQQILSIKQEALIIVLEHDPNFIGDHFQFQKSNYNVFKSKPYDDLQPQTKINLKDEIFKLIDVEISKNQNYLADVPLRIKSLNQFTILLQIFEIDNNLARNVITICKKFMELIKNNKDKLHSRKFLPLNYFFAKRCLVYNSLLNDADIDNHKRNQLNEELSIFDNELNQCSQTPILQVFRKIIEYKNFIGLNSIIAKLLKGYLDDLSKSLIEQQNQDSLQIKGINQDKKQAKQNIESYSFSIEYIIRELYLLGRSQKKQNQQYYKNYIELAQQQIKQGQPFEVIDGNNLQFISGIYDEIFYIDESVLVVSVIGPQSSGKSLLLNFLFGTQFQSSAGRCTKGVYGTIIELKCSHGQKYKKILLLDTEGIQAVEGRDEKFDKRIVFYILCVSHVVLICNKGEINSKMSEVIQLAADAMSSLKEDRVHGMNINIIMNMLSETNDTSLTASATQLSDAINEIDKNLNIFTTKDVFMLPFAFDGHGINKMKVNQPSANFSGKLESLRKRILEKLFNTDLNQQSTYTLREWFQYAHRFWMFTESYKNDYQNIQQKRQDIKLLNKMNSLIDEFFSSQQVHREDLKLIIENALKSYEGQVVINIQTLQSAIQEQFLQKQKQITNKMQTELLQFCGEQSINASIRDKRSNFLLTIINQFYRECNNKANIEIAHFMQKKSQIIGDQRLSIYISKFLESKQSYTVQEADQKFHQAWHEAKTSIKSNYQSRLQVADEIFALIHGYYQNEMMKDKIENVIKDYLQEHKQLVKYQKEGFESLRLFLLGRADQFLYFNGFNGHQSTSNVSKIIAFQESRKKYLANLTHKFYDDFLYVYMNSMALINDKLNLQKFFDDIERNLTSINLSPKNIEEIYKVASHLYLYLKRFDLELNMVFMMHFKNFEQTLLKQQEDKSIGKIINVEQLNSLFNKFKVYIQSNISSMIVYNQDFSNRYNYVPQNYHIQSSHQILEVGYIEISKNPIVQLNEKIFENEPHVLRYFKYLQNPQEMPINQNSIESEQAKQYLFKQINSNHVIIFIERIVICNLKIDGESYNQTVDDWLQKIKNDKSQEMINKFKKLDRQVVQKIIMQIKEFITKINEELDPFCFKISDQGSYALQLIGITFLNALVEEIEYNDQYHPLQIWENSISVEKDIFIAQLTSNQIAIDLALAKKTGLGILYRISLQAKESTMDKLKKNIMLINNEFNKNKVIQSLEDFAMKSANISSENQNVKKKLAELKKGFGFTHAEVVSFYVDPREYLQKKFLSQWGKNTNTLIVDSKKNYIIEMKENLCSVISFFKSLQKQLIEKNSNITSSQLFVNQKCVQVQQVQPDPKVIKIEENIDNQKKAAAIYLIMMLTNKWEQHSVIKLSDGQIYIPFPNRVLPIPQEVFKTPSKLIVDEITLHLQGQKITKFDNYIEGIVQQLEKDDILNVDIMEKLLQDFKNTFVGCNEYCPLCRRECDIVHDEAVLVKDRIHQCIGGHQLLCFGGIRQNGSNEAVTIGCNHIKDNQDIIYKDKKMKWSEYKKTIKSWKFDDSQGRLLISDQKNTTIWNSIGPQICDYYNKNKIDIKFVPTTHILQGDALILNQYQT